MLKLTQGKTSAKHGVLQTSGNAVVGIEKYTLAVQPNSVWKVEKYWEHPMLSTLPISRMKIDLEQKITEAFANDGQISIRELYDVLETGYGFAPCNLSAFLAGFLLKEYGCEPYRYWDSQNGHESMTPDKLAEMLGNYIGNTNFQKYKDTYIVKMTSAEMAFYALTEKAFEILPNSCATAGQAALAFLDTATFFDDLNDESKRIDAFFKHVIGDYVKILTDVSKVQDKLDLLTIEPYDWFSHPQVKDAIRRLAEAEYNAGGSDTALAILGNMTVEQRDEYIKRLVKENVSVGIEIITRGEE